MKTPPLRWKHLNGAVMVFALLIILTGAVVLAAWAQMMATQAMYPDNIAEGQKRRIAVANGRALARQYLLQAMPTGQSTNASYNLANGWGGFSFLYMRSFFWSDTNFVEGNPFNPFGGRSFVISNWCFISSSITNEEYWTYRIRSRSPILGGYPLVIQNPGASTNTNLAANVRAATTILWTNLTGFSNAPVPPVASGMSATNAYQAVFSSPMSTFATNDLPASDVIASNMQTNGGNLTASLDINPSVTVPYSRYVVPLTTTVVDVSGTNAVTNTYTVTGLNLVGSAATNVLHVIANTTNVTNVVLVGDSNTRKIYLNRSGGALTLSTSGYTNGSWWLGMTLSNCPLTVVTATNGVVNLRGGVRTDSTITVTPNSGIFTNTLESSPGDVETVADRVLWLEETRSQ